MYFNYIKNYDKKYKCTISVLEANLSFSASVVYI